METLEISGSITRKLNDTMCILKTRHCLPQVSRWAISKSFLTCLPLSRAAPSTSTCATTIAIATFSSPLTFGQTPATPGASLISSAGARMSGTFTLGGAIGYPPS